VIVKATTESTREQPTSTPPAPWCVNGWTEWFNNSHPENDAGDFEHIDDIRESGANICSQEEISKIQCKYYDPESIGQADLKYIHNHIRRNSVMLKFI
jgi:hypothetical protein